MRSLGTILIELVVVAAICAGVWFGGPKLWAHIVGAHDQAVVATATVGTQAAALTTGAAAAGQANTACLRSSSAGYRAGMAAARAIDNPPPAPAGQHPSVDAAGFKKLVGGGQ